MTAHTRMPYRHLSDAELSRAIIRAGQLVRQQDWQQLAENDNTVDAEATFDELCAEQDRRQERAS